MRRMLHMKHGLGDAVQFQIVVRHLQQAYPDDEITVETNYPEVFRGLCNTAPLARAFSHTKWNYDQSHYIRFARPEKAYEGIPSTKATRCLIEEFRLNPNEDLYFYELSPDADDEKVVDEWLAKAGLTGRKLVAVHYQGVSSPERKDLHEWEADMICDGIKENDFVPVIIDYDQKSGLPDGESIYRADIPRSVTVLADLLERCELFFAIDSGPLHVAAAMSVPTVAMWREFWPGHNIDPAPNQCHWFCRSSVDCIEGEWTEADDGWTNPAYSYFVKEYVHNEYMRLDWDLTTLFKDWKNDAAEKAKEKPQEV